MNKHISPSLVISSKVYVAWKRYVRSLADTKRYIQRKILLGFKIFLDFVSVRFCCYCSNDHARYMRFARDQIINSLCSRSSAN